jgi:hypothetical protein
MALKYNEASNAAAQGIPARDLTDEEVKAYGESDLLALRSASGEALYRHFTKAEIHAARKAQAEAHPDIVVDDIPDYQAPLAREDGE